MRWIGLTGGIASGKSTAAEHLQKKGLPVIYADRVAHLALDPGSATSHQIVTEFGKDILNAQGAIDRALLGERIFQDSSLRQKLENIVHPFVRQEVARQRSELEAQGHEMAIYEVPLLFEKNMDADFDEILLIDCDRDEQKRRLMSRSGLSEEQAEARLQSQLDRNEKKSRAHVVIDNSGAPEDLLASLDSWLELQK